MSSAPKDPAKSDRLPFEPSRKRVNASDRAPDSASAKSGPAKSASAKASGQAKSSANASGQSASGQGSSDRTGSKANVSDAQTDTPRASRTGSSPTGSSRKDRKDRSPDQESGQIPAVVSQRMGRRMAFFSGIPTGLGVLTFFVSYLIVSQGWYKLPNVAVLLVSMGWFGLGVVGLSYGVLSSSWDEERVGTRLGTEEFKTNFDRLTSAWKSRQKT
jgi:Photosynthesis affected mutant 68